jgi:hypothetical protein
MPMAMIVEALRRTLQRRPWWMNLMLAFCLYMTFVYLPFDLFVKPVARDAEVWFGVTVYGWTAKITEPLHWAIYAAGSYGFWHMRRWMWPWAALYVAQVALGMLVWSVRNPHGAGWLAGGAVATLFVGLAVLLWRARSRFATARAD